MSITKSHIDEFFAAYAAALSARDASKIAEFWGVPSLVLSDEGAIPVAKLDEVEKFFAGSMAQYEKVARAIPNIVGTRLLSDEVAACQVAWGHENAKGESVGGESGHYLLRSTDSALRIHAYTPMTTGRS